MQDRKTYAKGNTITTEGFRCSVGEPIDIKVTVGEDKEVDLHGEAGTIIPYGDYLITLEVNGEKAAYRDLYHLGDPVTVGDYTISDDMYLDGVSEGDEVVMRLEPVELMVTDTFRAAVKSLGGSESSGGGSGGGVLVVNITWNEDTATLDKTWQEIHDADAVVIYDYAPLANLKEYYPIATVETQSDPISGGTQYVVTVCRLTENAQLRFVASSASGYPVYVD
jgi:hypothetical protein